MSKKFVFSADNFVALIQRAQEFDAAILALRQEEAKFFDSIDLNSLSVEQLVELEQAQKHSFSQFNTTIKRLSKQNPFTPDGDWDDDETDFVMEDAVDYGDLAD